MRLVRVCVFSMFSIGSLLVLFVPLIRMLSHSSAFTLMCELNVPFKHGIFVVRVSQSRARAHARITYTQFPRFRLFRR